MNVPELEIHIDEGMLARALRADARAGLTDSPKWLPPKYFYDARGSALFEQITELPEYYPTRCERAILAEHAADIARLTGAQTLVELGAGSSEKTRLLLDALAGRGTLRQFVPLDVSQSALQASTAAIAADYPGLRVHGVVGDFFSDHLKLLPRDGVRLVAFLGGTIGNLLPAERADFLRAVRAVLDPGEWLLLGADLVKDPAVLVPAYDDAAGITAQFNRNVLCVLNRELGARFDPQAFEHVARWNPEHEWIEMRLRASHPMTVPVPGLELDVAFAAGEELRTEVSAKFRREGLQAELAVADLTPRQWWTDPTGSFAVCLALAGGLP